MLPEQIGTYPSSRVAKRYYPDSLATNSILTTNSNQTTYTNVQLPHLSEQSDDSYLFAREQIGISRQTASSPLTSTRASTKMAPGFYSSLSHPLEVVRQLLNIPLVPELAQSWLTASIRATGSCRMTPGRSPQHRATSGKRQRLRLRQTETA